MTIVGRAECSTLITGDIGDRWVHNASYRSRESFGDKADDFALGWGGRRPADAEPRPSTTLRVGDRVIGGQRGALRPEAMEILDLVVVHAAVCT